MYRCCQETLVHFNKAWYLTIYLHLFLSYTYSEIFKLIGDAVVIFDGHYVKASLVKCPSRK